MKEAVKCSSSLVPHSFSSLYVMLKTEYFRSRWNASGCFPWFYVPPRPNGFPLYGHASAVSHGAPWLAFPHCWPHPQQTTRERSGVRYIAVMVLSGRSFCLEAICFPDWPSMSDFANYIVQFLKMFWLQSIRSDSIRFWCFLQALLIKNKAGSHRRCACNSAVN